MSQADPPCIIGRGIHIKGSVRGAEEVVLEGTVEGRIQLEGHLAVESTGRVQAEVAVSSCAVAGSLAGRVEALDYVSLHAGATVDAELKAPRIAIEDGVHFTGHIDMDVPLPEDL